MSRYVRVVQLRVHGPRQCVMLFCRLCCQYKHAFQAVFGRDMGAGDTIVAGAVAGATASLVTNPLAVVTTRLTTQVCKQKRGKSVA